MYLIKTPYNCTFGASFTKQGKLARERNSKTASMGGQMWVIYATSHLNIDQRNIQKNEGLLEVLIDLVLRDSWLRVQSRLLFSEANYK